MQIACTTRPFAALPLGEICQRVAELGLHDVALFYARDARGNVAPVLDHTSTPADVAAVRRTAHDAGLAVPALLAAHPETPPGVDVYQRLIDHAAELGAGTLLSLGEGLARTELVSVLQSVAPRAESAGVTIVLKHHGGVLADAAALLALLDDIAHPAVRLALDPGNVLYYSAGQESPADALLQMRHALSAVCVKDCRVNGLDIALSAGDGEAGWPGLAARLSAARYDGLFLIEGAGGTTPQAVSASIACSVQRLRSWYLTPHTED
ncbi:sugar phosphate isomerase/epimerase family protein [Chitinibacteraceae bacterium HSL-7]